MVLSAELEEHTCIRDGLVLYELRAEAKTIELMYYDSVFVNRFSSCEEISIENRGFKARGKRLKHKLRTNLIFHIQESCSLSHQLFHYSLFRIIFSDFLKTSEGIIQIAQGEIGLQAMLHSGHHAPGHACAACG